MSNWKHLIHYGYHLIWKHTFYITICFHIISKYVVRIMVLWVVHDIWYIDLNMLIFIQLLKLLDWIFGFDVVKYLRIPTHDIFNHTRDLNHHYTNICLKKYLTFIIVKTKKYYFLLLIKNTFWTVYIQITWICDIIYLTFFPQIYIYL